MRIRWDKHYARTAHMIQTVPRVCVHTDTAAVNTGKDTKDELHVFMWYQIAQILPHF